MEKFKKGDKVKATNSIGEIKRGEFYTIKKAEGNFVHLLGNFEHGYLACEFKKALNIKKIKKLDDMQLINSRSETNAEKINEIIDVVNTLSKFIEENY